MLSVQHLEPDENPDRVRNQLGDPHTPVSEVVPEETYSGHPQHDFQLVRVDGHSSFWGPLDCLVRPESINTVMLTEGVLAYHLICRSLVDDTVEKDELAEVYR